MLLILNVENNITLTRYKNRLNSPKDLGFLIILTGKTIIKIQQKTFIPALLTLIRFEGGCENDLTKLKDKLTNISLVYKFELLLQNTDNLHI